jgi:hypothetical protein
MIELNHPTNLDDLGDMLSWATQRDARSAARRPIRRIAIAVTALAIVGTGSAAAAGLFTPKQVAAAMPAGAVLFDQTNPSCVYDAGGNLFHCTLSNPPTAGGAAPAEGTVNFNGTKEVLVANGNVAGGCIGQDAAGLSWDCYIGQDAVDHEIVTQDFLGEPAGPGRG